MTTDRKRWAVVDDDPMVLEVLGAFLGAITDAKLELFESPQEAYEAVSADPYSFEMIITDRTMPRMEGAGLLVLVRAVAPHLRMVMVTGNRVRLEHELALHDLPIHCVFKPFTRAQLKEAVKTAPVISSKIGMLDAERTGSRSGSAIK